jgi:hypothetical protein
MSLIIAQSGDAPVGPGIRGSQLGKYGGDKSGDFSLANMLYVYGKLEKLSGRAMRCGSQGNEEWVPNEGGNDG